MPSATPTPEHPWVPGLPTRVRLIEQIGRGGTATVWRARDTDAGRDVAVKLIVADGAGERLEREGRALVRLRDVAGVLTVHELGMATDGTAWLVCQLARRGSLRDRIGRPGVDSATCAEIGHVLASTLEAAHRLDVLHGDVTPGNVLFDDAPQPLLADFGSARLDSVTSGVPPGFTPAFAAPERLRGAPATAAGDVYSLGRTLQAACPDASTELGDVLRSCTSSTPGSRPDPASLADSLVELSGSRRRAAARRSGWWRR